jgi:hypothetical protein
LPCFATSESPAACARGERDAADPRLAGFEVVVIEPDPAYRDRASERAGDVLAEPPPEPFDTVVAQDGTDLTGITARKQVLVGQDGSVWSSA